jgi:hypothetical protein
LGARGKALPDGLALHRARGHVDEGSRLFAARQLLLRVGLEEGGLGPRGRMTGRATGGGARMGEGGRGGGRDCGSSHARYQVRQRGVEQRMTGAVAWVARAAGVDRMTMGKVGRPD